MERFNLREPLEQQIGIDFRINVLPKDLCGPADSENCRRVTTPDSDLRHLAIELRGTPDDFWATEESSRLG